VVARGHALVVLKAFTFKYVLVKAELAVFKVPKVLKEPQYKELKELRV
jgi:hypothetical protein